MMEKSWAGDREKVHIGKLLGWYSQQNLEADYMVGVGWVIETEES